MHTLPEFAHILAFLGLFSLVFALANGLARAAGYRE